VEHLQVAPFKDRLLAIPTNIGPDLKSFARGEQSSLFGLFVIGEEKVFEKVK
jgi:hypothetical protein